MFRISVKFTLDEAASKMVAAMIVRSAVLSASIPLRDVVIEEIEYVPGHDEDQLSLLEAVDEDDNLCADCGHVTHADDLACKGCGALTDLGEMRAARDAALEVAG